MHAKTHLNKLNYGALVDHLLKDKLIKCFVVSPIQTWRSHNDVMQESELIFAIHNRMHCYAHSR